MRKRGKKTDKKLLVFVSAHAGLTVRQIGKQLSWSIGRADGSVNRLAKLGKVKIQHSLRRGILVKKVFARTHRPVPHDLIEIPRKIIADKNWKKSAKLYALSRSTIGISPIRREEWEKKALSIEEIEIDTKRKNFQIRIPERLSEFYELENSETSLSAMDDLALLTIESTLLPIDLPSTYPAEVSFKIEREIYIKETIEGSIACNPFSEIEATLGNPRGKVTIHSDLADTSKREISPTIVTDNSETDKRVIPIEVIK